MKIVPSSSWKQYIEEIFVQQLVQIWKSGKSSRLVSQVMWKPGGEKEDTPIVDGSDYTN